MHFILLQHTQTCGKQPCEKLDFAQRKVKGGQQCETPSSRVKMAVVIG